MRAASFLLVVTLLVAGCGSDGTSSQTDDPSTAATPVRPATTAAPSTSTMTVEPTTTAVAVEPAVDLTVLRPDGVGEVDFGTPADDAIAELSAMLGPPDRVETIEPVFADCVEGSSWLDCVHARRVIDVGRLAVWEDLGLEVALVDSGPDGSPTALQFADWQATVASGGSELTTPEGISVGMTVGALKSVAPEVEFTYNEGALDSFYVWNDQTGGYWGRLDWKPATVEIEYRDVAAMQAALNDHGADLDVDGIWGPRTEAAWLAFLTGQGIEPAPPQLWLTPEVGAALGLPPDDITVATIEPRPPLDRTVPTESDALPILRVDGLGRYDFGEPANELVDEFTAMFGPPTDEVIFSAQPPDRLYMPGGYHALHDLAQYEWTDPQLLVIVGDTPYRGNRWDEPVPGVSHLITWETSSGVLRLENGLGVGSTLQDVRTVHPGVTVGRWDVCETDYWPADFATAGPFSLHGRLDWDWVSDLQRALNERGADLDVDGIYGPATTEAVRAFQHAEGIDAEGPGDFGRAGPLTIEALGLVAPEGATIRYLRAGYRGSC